LAAPAPTRISTLVAQNWPTTDRPAIQLEPVVAPGQIGTFTFAVRAPLQPGVYPLSLRPVIDGTVWMENQGVFELITSRAVEYHSAWVSQSAYPTVHAGSLSGPVTFTFKNTGSQAWVKGVVGAQANLGVIGDTSGLAAAWPTADRVAVQSEASVQPGQTGTFTFQVKAPPVPGQYRLRLRPVVDGIMWLEDQGLFTIVTVVP